MQLTLVAQGAADPAALASDDAIAEGAHQARARHLSDRRVLFRDAVASQQRISRAADRANSAAQRSARASAGGRLRRAAIVRGQCRESVSTPQAIAIYENPRGGRATETYVIDGVLVQSHQVPPFSRYKVRQYVMPARGFVRVTIVTMPEGGISYPMRLIFAPDDGSVAPGAPGSPGLLSRVAASYSLVHAALPLTGHEKRAVAARARLRQRATASRRPSSAISTAVIQRCDASSSGTISASPAPATIRVRSYDPIRRRAIRRTGPVPPRNQTLRTATVRLPLQAVRYSSKSSSRGEVTPQFDAFCYAEALRQRGAFARIPRMWSDADQARVRPARQKAHEQREILARFHRPNRKNGLPVAAAAFDRRELARYAGIDDADGRRALRHRGAYFMCGEGGIRDDRRSARVSREREASEVPTRIRCGMSLHAQPRHIVYRYDDRYRREPRHRSAGTVQQRGTATARAQRQQDLIPQHAPVETPRI